MRQLTSLGFLLGLVVINGCNADLDNDAALLRNLGNGYSAATDATVVAPQVSLDYRINGGEKLLHRNRGISQTTSFDPDHVATGVDATVGEGRLVVDGKAYPVPVVVRANDLQLYEAALALDHPSLESRSIRNTYLALGLDIDGEYEIHRDGSVTVEFTLRDTLKRMVSRSSLRVASVFPAPYNGKLTSKVVRAPSLHRDCIALAALTNGQNLLPNTDGSDLIRFVNNQPVQADEPSVVAAIYYPRLPGGASTRRDQCAMSIFSTSRSAAMGFNALLQAPATAATNPTGVIAATFIDVHATNPASNLFINNLLSGTPLGANKASDFDFGNVIDARVNGGIQMASVVVASDDPQSSAVVYQTQGVNPADGGVYTRALNVFNPSTIGFGRTLHNSKRIYATHAIKKSTSVRATADIIQVNAASTLFGCRPGLQFLRTDTDLINQTTRWTEVSRANILDAGGALLPNGSGCNTGGNTYGRDSINLYGTDLFAWDWNHDGYLDLGLINTAGGSQPVFALLINQGTDSNTDDIYEYRLASSSTLAALLPGISTDARVLTAVLPRLQVLALDPLENRGATEAMIVSTANNGMFMWVYNSASGWVFENTSQLPTGNFNDFFADDYLTVGAPDRALDVIGAGNGNGNNGVFYGTPANPNSRFATLNLGSGATPLAGFRDGNAIQSIARLVLQAQSGNTNCNIWEAAPANLIACINAAPGAVVTLAPAIGTFANNSPGSGFVKNGLRYTRGLFVKF